MLRAKSSLGLTLETAINVSDMALGENAKGLGEVDEWRALTGVNAAQPDDSDLGQWRAAHRAEQQTSSAQRVMSNNVTTVRV